MGSPPGIRIRARRADEEPQAEALSRRNLDPISAYFSGRLPCYFEMSEAVDQARQGESAVRLPLGAFDGDQLIGCLRVSRVDHAAYADTSEVDWESIKTRFGEHSLAVFANLQLDWHEATIGAPDGALIIEALCVDGPHRGRGVAGALLREAIHRLAPEEVDRLHIEVVRTRRAMRFCRNAGFRPVKRSFDPAHYLRFGVWGTALLRCDAAHEKTRGAGSR